MAELDTADRAAAFRQSIRGEVVSDSDPEDEYLAAKQIWNGDWEIVNRPKYVCHCRGVADVQKALRFALAEGLRVSVRCGGHSLKGLSTSVGGIVIDLGKHMRSVRVDTTTKEVWFQGGCLVKDVDAETEPYGVCTVLGAVGNAGTGGLVSGGGFGYWSRKKGMAIDNVLAFDVVDYKGNLIRADAHENADLYWGCRGGQSNFGIITSFTMRVFDCPPLIYGGLVIYEMTYAEQVIKAVEKFCNDPELPLECSTHIYSLSLSPTEKMLAVQLCYLGDPSIGEAIYEPLINCAPHVDNQSKATTYVDYQVFSDEVYRIKGIPSYWRSRNVADGVSLPVHVIIESIKSAPPEGILVLEHYGGAVRKRPEEYTAFPHRDHDWVITLTGFGFANRDARDGVKSWIDTTTESLEAILLGSSYLNYDCGTPHQSFGKNLRRLREIKRRYDPTNFFTCNINIPPASDSEEEIDDDVTSNTKSQPVDPAIGPDVEPTVNVAQPPRQLPRG